MPLDRTASRFLVPLGTLLALGVAVGVWMVPSSVLDPRPPEVPAPDMPVPNRPAPETQRVPERSTWMETADELDSLREPDPETDEPDEPEPEPIDDGEPDDETAPPPIRLSWTYDGMVEQPRGAAALITMGATQRFLFEGQTLGSDDDPSIPPNMDVVLHKIERDRVIVLIDGGRQVIERSDVAPPTRAPDNRTPAQRRRS